jgi:diguanylate cyclase (GGDEF)-like protein
MNRYQYDKTELNLIESSPIPCAAYQFIDKRVVTLALSRGVLDLMNADTMEEAYYIMDNDMYRDIHPDDVEEAAEAAVRFATGDGEFDIAYRSRLGEDYIIIHAKGTHLYKADGERIAVVQYMNEGIYRDESKETILGVKQQFENFILNKEGALKGAYDQMTGMPNLNYFFELAEAAFEGAYHDGRKISMLFMDLGGMKAYNQKYGYAEGDKLITAAGKTLVHYFSNENCCRVTADHFAIYYDQPDLNEKLADLVEEIKHINNGNTLPMRIGVYESSSDYVSATTACDRAKIACDSIGNIFESTIVYFDVAMLRKFEARRYIFENLDRAISEGWIKVGYQPIVRTANGKVCDEEALVRWMDPIRGVIPPLDFIPILEDARISYKLDLYVLDQVLEKLKNQAAEGLDVVPNSINLSRADFYACDMVEEIRRRVDDAGIDRSKITIEITESVIMDDVDSMKTQVDRFRELGFSVWMDDFGSGYSSPDILQKIHFDVIKLDKLLIDGIEENEGSRIVVSTCISMARGLGSEVLAEGVETARQVLLLKEMECSKLQGYYYCKPVPLETIIERNRLGIQIGFETAEDAARYSSRRR